MSTAACASPTERRAVRSRCAGHRYGQGWRRGVDRRDCDVMVDPKPGEEHAREPKAQRATAGESDLPLAGVKVADFTAALAGPLATMCLADMGADVLKIEDADRGEMARDT